MEITTVLFHILLSILVIHGVSLLILLKSLVFKFLVPHLPFQVRARLLLNHHPCPFGPKMSLKFLGDRELSINKLYGSSSEIECVFCLNNIGNGEEIRELKCMHLFHKTCLDEWLEYGQATCPLCRSFLFSVRVPVKDIREEGDGRAFLIR